MKKHPVHLPSKFFCHRSSLNFVATGDLWQLCGNAAALSAGTIYTWLKIDLFRLINFLKCFTFEDAERNLSREEFDNHISRPRRPPVLLHWQITNRQTAANVFVFANTNWNTICGQTFWWRSILIHLEITNGPIISAQYASIWRWWWITEEEYFEQFVTMPPACSASLFLSVRCHTSVLFFSVQLPTRLKLGIRIKYSKVSHERFILFCSAAYPFKNRYSYSIF